MSAIESASKISYTKIISGLEQLKKEELEEVIDRILQKLRLKLESLPDPNVWRGLTRYNYWDFPKYLKLVKEQHHYLLLPQSLGAVFHNLENEIKVGDKFINHHIFKIKGKSVHKIAMKGIVASTIQEGNNHQIHPCNKGKNRPHADTNNKFIWVLITEVYDEKEQETIEWNKIRPTWLKL